MSPTTSPLCPRTMAFPARIVPETVLPTAPAGSEGGARPGVVLTFPGQGAWDPQLLRDLFTKMGFPEVDLGVCPAVVAPWLILRVGAGRQRQGEEQHVVLDDENAGWGGQNASGLQRSQPGGTAARRASSSMAAMALRLASRSALTRSSSAMAVARCCAISARR